MNPIFLKHDNSHHNNWKTYSFEINLTTNLFACMDEREKKGVGNLENIQVLHSSDWSENHSITVIHALNPANIYSFSNGEI